MGLIAGMQGQVNIKNQCELSYKFKKKIVILLIDEGKKNQNKKNRKQEMRRTCSNK